MFCLSASENPGGGFMQSSIRPDLEINSVVFYTVLSMINIPALNVGGGRKNLDIRQGIRRIFYTRYIYEHITHMTSSAMGTLNTNKMYIAYAYNYAPYLSSFIFLMYI